MITFTVPGQPIPKARARIGGGHGYTPDRTKGHEESIIVAAREAGYRGEPDAESTFNVTIAFHRKGKARADIDNLAKTVLDALNKVVWKDDNQINVLTLGKRINMKNPQTIITIKERRLGDES